MMRTKRFTNKSGARIVFALASFTALRFLFKDDGDYDGSASSAMRRQLELVHDDADNVVAAAPNINDANDKNDNNNNNNRQLQEERLFADNEQVMNRLKDTVDLWIRGDYIFDSKGRSSSNAYGREEEAEAAARARLEFEEKQRWEEQHKPDYEPLTVCGRPANVGSTEVYYGQPTTDSIDTHPEQHQCPEITQDKPIMLIQGKSGHGRTGNGLIEFLHAIQKSRDQNVQLGIMADSWAMSLLLKMWMDDYVNKSDNKRWTTFENAFCVKIFQDVSELEGWDDDAVIPLDPKELLHYGGQVKARLPDYMESQQIHIRTLFRHINSSTRRIGSGKVISDMCSGIKSLFGNDKEEGQGGGMQSSSISTTTTTSSSASAMYSVIHGRSLGNTAGFRMLKHLGRRSGCDKTAALDMRPEYVKSILEPLGMTGYPIVFITDGENDDVLKRLRADPDIGPMVREVPWKDCWLGGDITLAVMSNVFIGNPASTFSGFIAKARLALGFGHSYLFRARDGNGQWRTVCGDACVFDKSIMGSHA